MVDFDPSDALPQAEGDPRRFDDLIARAHAAVTVKEECAVVWDAIRQLGEGHNDRSGLATIVGHVRSSFAPRAVLLGAVAALVPDGLGWGVEGPVIHRHGPRHYEARCGYLSEVGGPTPALALLIAIMEAGR